MTESYNESLSQDQELFIPQQTLWAKQSLKLTLICIRHPLGHIADCLDLLCPGAVATRSLQFCSLQLVSGRFIPTAPSSRLRLLPWGVSVGAGACDTSPHPRSQSRSLCVVVVGMRAMQRGAGRCTLPSLLPRQCSEAPSPKWPLGRWPHQGEGSSRDQLSNTLSYRPPDLPCFPHSVSRGLSPLYKIIS